MIGTLDLVEYMVHHNIEQVRPMCFELTGSKINGCCWQLHGGQDRAKSVPMEVQRCRELKSLTHESVTSLRLLDGTTESWLSGYWTSRVPDLLRPGLCTSHHQTERCWREIMSTSMHDMYNTHTRLLCTTARN